MSHNTGSFFHRSIILSHCPVSSLVTLFVKRVIFNNLQKKTNHAGITTRNIQVKVASYNKWFIGTVINMFSITSFMSVKGTLWFAATNTAHAYFPTRSKTPEKVVQLFQDAKTFFFYVTTPLRPHSTSPTICKLRSWKPVFPTSLQRVQLVECGFYVSPPAQTDGQPWNIVNSAPFIGRADA